MPSEFVLGEDSSSRDDDEPGVRPEERPPLTSRKSQSLPTFLHERRVQEAVFTNLMAGRMDWLPERSSRAVRVFISSTFSDMHLERNVLMQRVYPKLKEMCLTRYGLAFQMVDMRWGIQDGASLDQMASEICMQEISHCQNTSVGPHFLAILSHRYGARKLPYTVEKSVMETLMKVMKNSGMEDALELTSEWYRLDENQLDPVFVLQPVVAKDATASEHSEALSAWRNAEAKLLNALHICVTSAKEADEISEDRALRFTASVTHQEVLTGVQRSSAERRQDAMLFNRQLTDVRDFVRTKQSTVSRFIDVKDDGEIDDDIYRLLNTLKHQQLPMLLPKENIAEYQLASKAVLDLNSKESKEYEKRLEKEIISQLKRSINRAVKKFSALDSDSLYSEVLQHSHQCVGYVRQFQGREDTMSQVKSYIESDVNHPLMIHGASGCGKTSVMARAATLARDWLPQADQDGAVVIIRFLGTSPSSTSIRQTLRSICQQMVSILGSTELPEGAHDEDFRETVNNFYKLAEKLNQQSRRVLIFLDSIDQLDSPDGAHTLRWLRPNLPTRTKIVLSTLPDLFDILSSCRSLFRDIDSSRCFVEVGELNPELCCQIVRDMLTERGRCLTEPQWAVLQSAFAKCSLPIYMNLVFNQVVGWKSYTTVNSGSLENTVRGAIEHLFTRLERQHGQLLVSHALAYITASRSGLSEGEIEDLLSLDEDVLGEVFAHHLPPFIRLPPLCWTRVRHEIGPYLVEREADETRVLTWYHRQFWEVARDRYFANADFCKATHSRLADYFLGVWAGRPKPFKCPQKLAAKLARQGTPPPSEADRQVPAQPHVLQRDDDGSVRFSLRKLSELPFHLVNSGRVDEFHDHVTFSMDYLESKLSATSHHLLLRDLQLFFDLEESARGCRSDSEDAKRLFNALRIAGPSLKHSPLCLPVDICGRLREFAERSSRIRKLLSDCRQREHSTCILPLNACFDSGSSFTHCNLQVQMSLGRLCENGYFYSTPVSDNIVTWFDSDCNVMSTVTCEKFPLGSAKLSAVLPRSGSILSLEYLQLTETYRLYKANLLSGVWRPLIANIADVISSSYYGDDNPFVSSENHIILKSSTKSECVDWFVCLKPEPLKVAYFAANKKCPPLISKDNFVFYIGSAASDSSSDSSDSPIEARPRALLLDDFSEVCLDCAEFESGELLNCKALVQDYEILLVSTSKHELESTVTFTIHRFVVGSNKSIQEDICCKVKSAQDPGGDFNIAMSLDRSTVAICFTCLKESMGFLCKLPQCTFIPLAFHPILAKSAIKLKSFEYDVPNSIDLHISHDGRFLLSKTKCQYMFNIWSAQDGSFLTAIPYSENFYCLGQMPGTDYFLIGSVSERINVFSFSLTKVLKLSMLAAYGMDSQNERMTRQQLADAVFYIDAESGRFVSGQFDQESGGSAWEWDLRSTRQSRLLLQQSGQTPGTSSSDIIPEDLQPPTASNLSLKAPAEDMKRKFVDSLMQVLKDRVLHDDLRHCNVLLLQEPGSLQVSLVNAKDIAALDGKFKSHQGVRFEVPRLFPDFKIEEKILSGAVISERLRKQIGGKELDLLISNHVSLKSLPINYLLPGQALKSFSHDTQLSGVLCKDRSEIHLLVKTEPGSARGSGELTEVQEGDNDTRISEESLLCTLDVKGRSAKQCIVLPSLQLERQFMRYTGRQVAIERLRRSAFNLRWNERMLGFFCESKSEGNRQNELVVDLTKQVLRYSLDFIREKINYLCTSENGDYSVDTEILHQDMISYIHSSIVNAPEFIEVLPEPMRVNLADNMTTKIFTIEGLSFFGLKYNLKLSATDSCTPVMVFKRPRHPHHVVVLYMCDSVSSYADALDRERMCWPGRLVVCNTNSMQVVSVSRTFDAGALYLLPDGAHCVTYRLKVFNIETGDLVRDLDPTDSVILIDMVATPDRRLVVGKQLEFQRDFQNVDEFMTESREINAEVKAFMAAQSIWRLRVLQAYSTSDGTLLFNYRLETNPLALLVPSNDRLLLLLRDHPIQLYEILGCENTEAALLPAMETGNTKSVLVAEILKCDYLKFVKSVLTLGLARVARDRPADPIESLAHWLLNFAAAHPAAQPAANWRLN